MNLYSYEKVCERRRQELQREMEQTRLGMSAQQHQANPSLGRRIIGNVGKSLVSLVSVSLSGSSKASDTRRLSEGRVYPSNPKASSDNILRRS